MDRFHLILITGMLAVASFYAFALDDGMTVCETKHSHAVCFAGINR